MIDGPLGEAANPLVSELRSTIDPARDPWKALAEALTTVEAERQRQLGDRLAAQATENVTPVEHHRWRRGRSEATPPAPVPGDR